MRDMTAEDARQLIAEECDSIKEMLLDKNAKYGNSALSPVRVFSQADPAEQLKVRIDDKLKRIQNAIDDDDEDAVGDLIGYLVLLRAYNRFRYTAPDPIELEGFKRLA